MRQVKVEICCGTTCYVMGASDLETLADHLSPDVREFVEVKGVHCLGYCDNRNYGKAPFVRINGKVLNEATLAQVVASVEAAARET